MRCDVALFSIIMGCLLRAPTMANLSFVDMSLLSVFGKEIQLLFCPMFMDLT